ncbi:Zonadhesin [Pleurostoma richardsiae]|uniref:Zonadhesin n=1 Tax=Pleurostoma richardsiae TaxID=41990 RepID=A0AA38R444_9PEZI|nr:Zonadhesin [Pleurostoma richardsiae]
MFQPREQAELSAYQYNVQATEDYEQFRDRLDRNKEVLRPRGSRGNYRPTPLRWPFILCQIILLCGAIGVIVYVDKAMPHSESTVEIEGRAVAMRRDENTTSTLDGSIASSDAAVTSLVSSSAAQVLSATSSVSETLDGSELSSLTAAATPTTDPSTSSVALSTPSSTLEVTTTAETIVSSTVLPTTVSSLSTADETPETTSSTPDTTTAAETSETTSSVSDGTTSSATATLSQQSKAGSSVSRSSDSSASAITSTDSASSSGLSSSRTLSTASSVSGSSSSTLTSLGSSSASTPQLSSTSETTRQQSSSTPRASASSAVSSTSTPPKTSVSSTSQLTSSSSVTSSRPSTSSSTGTSSSGGHVSTGVTVITTRVPKTYTKPGTTVTFVTSVSTVITSTIVVTFSSVLSGTAYSTTQLSTFTLSAHVSSASDESFARTTEEVTTFSSAFLTSEPATTVLGTSTSEVAYTTVVSSVATSTESAQVYVSYGETVITSSYTVQVDPTTENRPPQTQTVVDVHGGATYTFVQTQAPQTHVTDVVQVVTGVYTPPAETDVTLVAGSQMTEVIVVTPSAQTNPVLVNAVTVVDGTLVTYLQTQSPQTRFTLIDGVLTTIVETPPPQTVVATEGGVLTTIGVMSTPQGSFEPVTYSFLTTVGGTLTTMVLTQPPQSVVTTIDGTAVTLWTTPPPETLTTVVGGTPTTEVSVTTPTGTEPITMTIVTSISGRLSTLVTTRPASTFLSTISSKLTTVDSSSLRTSLSTKSASTTTVYSVSTPTPTGSGGNGSVVVTTQSFSLSPADYFVGTFLPIFVAVMLVIPLRIIDLNAKLYQPFHALTKPGGASGADSMTLEYNGLKGFITPAVTLAQGHPVPFVTTLMVTCASFMAPLATEALGLKIHGQCKITAIEGCAVALGISPAAAYALIGIISLIILLLLSLLFILRGWETGVYANPWNIAGIASLASNPDLCMRPMSEARIRKDLAHKQFAFGYYDTPDGEEHYGIVLLDQSGQALQHRSVDDRDEQQRGQSSEAGGRMPFIALGYAWRIGFMLLLIGLLTLILYYHLTLSQPSSFKAFMNTHSFGVRFFFAALGVLITFAWASLFISVAVIVPYQAMSKRGQPPETSILVSQPTNAFSGLYAAFRQRHPYLFVAALMAVLAEFLPVILSNVPYSLTQTLASHNVCARLSIALLTLMIAAVAASFLVRWPRLPVDPRSIAGAAYYIGDSAMAADFTGLSRLDAKEKDQRVKEMGRRYFYGEMLGRSGWRRMGVDSEGGMQGGTAYAGFQLDRDGLR